MEINLKNNNLLQSNNPAKVKQGYLVVGLGNPGEEYSLTRHNIGFMVVNELAKRCRLEFKKWRTLALITKGQYNNRSVVFAKPTAYMNLSGNAVVSLLSYYKISPTNLLVISDDVNLPLGKLRLRKQGSDGGHNGLASIIESLGTIQFSRLRVGVRGTEDTLPKDLAPYVLGRFNRPEQQMVKEIISHAADAIECFLEQGIDIAMSRFNS